MEGLVVVEELDEGREESAGGADRDAVDGEGGHDR